MCNDHNHLSRRGMLQIGASVAATSIIAGAMSTPASAQDVAPPKKPDPQNAITPEAALQRLKEGNARYVANEPRHQDFSVERAARSAAQFPIAGLISCADSRVSPEFVFDQGPGDVFVVRVAGNFVDTEGLASIEFGVAVLGIPLLMVLGHSGCGAIYSTIDVIENGTELPGHLPALIDALRPPVEASLKEKPEDPLKAATIANVKANVERLRTATPIVSEAVAAGNVMVIGGVYDIATGKVEFV